MDKISTSEKGRIPGKEGVMGEVIKVLDWLLENLVQICTVVLELFGIIVLVSTAVSCFVQWIQKQASADPPESGTGNCAGVGI